MIEVIGLYEDAVRDDANDTENGYTGYEKFNRNLRRAEMAALRFLTGDLVATADYPIPYQVQKIKDYLRPFITKHKANNDFPLPKDYYTWENLYKIGSFKTVACGAGEDDEDEEVTVKGCNTQIPILDGQAFYNRCNSYIQGLRPAEGNPIAKIVDNTVEIQPEGIGSVTLEYIRYPKFGEIKWALNPLTNEPVADPATSINLEWNEEAREMLSWFIVNKIATSTSNKSLKEFNIADKPRG